MDIENFEKTVSPGGKRSRLEVFSSEILRLKNKGYAYHQIQEWLASNGTRISRQAIEHFVRKKERNNQDLISPTISKPSSQNIINGSATEKTSSISTREEREQVAQQFIRDVPSKLLLQKINQEK